MRDAPLKRDLCCQRARLFGFVTRPSFSWNATIRAEYLPLEFLVEDEKAIVEWCKEEVLADKRFDVFKKDDDDVFFHWKGQD